MYADDVSQVLRDLHYARANFMGIPYGTAAERVFLLRHPGQVRTLTMQSGSPLTVPVYERAPGNSQLALDYAFARCESQPACHRAFPHLSADWARLWASVGKSPWVRSGRQRVLRRARACVTAGRPAPPQRTSFVAGRPADRWVGAAEGE